MPRSKATAADTDVGTIECAAGRSLTTYGVHLGIRTNRPEELGSLSDYFPPLWQPSARIRVDRVFSLLIGESIHVLFEEGDTAMEFARVEGLLATFESRVKMYVAEMSPQYVFVHAGAVGWQQKAILVPGRSYAGKTSLVAAMVRAGATYYSDEYAVLDLAGRVHPYPQPLEIRDPETELQKRCSAESLGGIVGTEPLPVGLVVLAPYKAEACWDPTPLPSGQAVLQLLANTVSARRKPGVVLQTLHRALAEASTLKGSRGEAKETAERILRL